MTDWEVVGRGALTLLGGVGSLAGAAAITPSGVGIPAAGYLAVQGVAATSFGLTQMIAGFAMDDNTSQTTSNQVKNMPASLTDAGCIALDGIAGNKNGEIRSVGAVIDLVVGAKAGTLAKFGSLISSPKVATGVGKGGFGITAAQEILLVYDASSKNTGSTKKATESSQNKKNNQNKPKQEKKNPSNFVELGSRN